MTTLSDHSKDIIRKKWELERNWKANDASQSSGKQMTFWFQGLVIRKFEKGEHSETLVVFG